MSEILYLSYGNKGELGLIVIVIAMALPQIRARAPLMKPASEISKSILTRHPAKWHRSRVACYRMYIAPAYNPLRAAGTFFAWYARPAVNAEMHHE